MSYPVSAYEKEIEIRYKGVYDLDGIYKLIRGWLDARRYDYMENIHKDKSTNPWGNEVEWEMRPELKVDGFIKYEIFIRTKFYDVKEFESIQHGYKRMLTDGRFWVEITGLVRFDYKDRYTTPLAKNLLELLVRRIFWRYYRVHHIEKLYKDMFDLHLELKKFMKLETAFNAYKDSMDKAY